MASLNLVKIGSGAWRHQAITWADVDLTCGVVWHSYEDNFTGNALYIYSWYEFEGYQF